MQSRREFVKEMVAGAAVLGAGADLAWGETSAAKGEIEICATLIGIEERWIPLFWEGGTNRNAKEPATAEKDDRRPSPDGPPPFRRRLFCAHFSKQREARVYRWYALRPWRGAM